MMGAHHAACGAAAWVSLTTQTQLSTAPLPAILPSVPGSIPLGFGLLEVSPAGIVTGALVTAGAAMVPDADHHNSSIAHSLPPLSNLLCAGIGNISGGHRHGSHSIIGLIAFTAVAFMAGSWTVAVPGLGLVYPGAGLLSVLLIAFAAKALGIMPDRMRKSPWAVGLALGTFIALFAPEQRLWFPIAMAVGVVTHILGDMLTTGGCNLLWPVRIKPPKVVKAAPGVSRLWRPNGFLSFPVLGNAGSLRERALLVPVGLYAVIGVAGALIRVGQDGLIAWAAVGGW